jgi:hypothetical protein
MFWNHGHLICSYLNASRKAWSGVRGHKEDLIREDNGGREAQGGGKGGKG